MFAASKTATPVSAANYIEDVFGTYLYTGNGSTQTITNNIDLSTKGGLVWLKSRSANTNSFLFDTVRGALNEINSNTDDAQASLAASLTAFNTTGFSLGAAAGINVNAATYVSWTFREQPKFFDVVTYTGTGAALSVAHNLGSVPGCIFIKRTDTTYDWAVWHRNNGTSAVTFFNLNGTQAGSVNAAWNNAVTSTTFNPDYIGPNSGDVNTNGGTYVAYIFAHDAGGFGLTGTDNVISCGSYTGNGSTTGPTINLGYEPQWVMVKSASVGGSGYSWLMFDNMRGLPAYGGGNTILLQANAVNAEVDAVTYLYPQATGFTIGSSSTSINQSGQTYIYVAIRRGPMKVPTTGTSVFVPTTTSSTSSFSVGFPTDVGMYFMRQFNVSTNTTISNRLNPINGLVSSNTDSEVAGQMNFTLQNSFQQNISANNGVNYTFRRSPSFMDVVCYTGTGIARTVTHNLQAVPEMMIVKNRSVTGAWDVYTATTGNTKFLELNTDNQQTTSSDAWNNTSPTSSVFTVGISSATNGSGNNLVAYLFATCAGVSKVGSYTGTGTTQTISCGFTNGARFVLIKRLNVDAYNWWVWDTARGMVSGTDPRLALNLTSAETNTDWVYTITDGFQIVTNSVNINANGGSYIFLAIA
jgi:hypothetical protein